jgi:hypothetical protein
MGGDLIDVVPQGEFTDVLLADVSGRGVQAGVVPAMLEAALRGRWAWSTVCSSRSPRARCTRPSRSCASTTSARSWRTLAGRHPVLLHRAAGGSLQRLAGYSVRGV